MLLLLLGLGLGLGMLLLLGLGLVVVVLLLLLSIMMRIWMHRRQQAARQVPKLFRTWFTLCWLPGWQPVLVTCHPLGLSCL
jgi:hypothetical protein